MVSFGDDFSDVGSISFLTSVVGESSAQYLTGFDPNYYYNNRFSNGPIWTDQLYTSLGLGAIGTLGTNDGENNLNGTDFAAAETRSGTGTYAGILPNLQTQVSNYSAQLANHNPALPAPATTLFTIWSGASDVLAHVESGGMDGVTPQDVANNISASITSLYAAGGRTFLVPNLPELGETPGYINDPIKRTAANSFVDSTNSLLNASLDSLSGSLAGIRIIKLDIDQLFLDISANPGLYGITNMTEPAYIRFGPEPYQPTSPPYGTVVANPDGYFYWDSIHGTALANALIGEAAYAAVTAIPEPSAYALATAGLLGVAILLRRNRRKAI